MPLLTTPQIWTRFAHAAALTTAVCLVVGYVFLKTTGVPSTYPPLLPQQIIAGTVGGALLVTLGYWLLTVFINDRNKLETVVMVLGVVLTIASFYLPYRLTYTTSPRFAGATIPALFGQGYLHSLVVGLSIFCFVRK